MIQYFKKMLLKAIHHEKDRLIFCVLNSAQYKPGDKIKDKKRLWEVTKVTYFSRLKILNNKYYFLYGVFGKEL